MTSMYVNQIQFDNIYDAATYIGGCENNTKDESSIRKTLNLILSGKRKSNIMYDRYVVDKVD